MGDVMEAINDECFARTVIDHGLSLGFFCFG